jgi:uncharacterized repeat protein (TIGR03803 family)
MKKYLLPFLALFIFTAYLCKAQTPTLWGTAGADGVQGGGTLFKTNADSIVNVHDFAGYNDGEFPFDGMFLAKNGLLYGMTSSGGDEDNGYGIIFSFDVTSLTETPLYVFGSNNNYSDGKAPNGVLIQVDGGLLYGLTSEGGQNGAGTIFSFNTSSGTETKLHDFANATTEGSNPFGTLFQATDGMLYGLTEYGGANDEGIIFSYDISTKKEADVHDFGSGNDGSSPLRGALIQVGDSLLYGMTSAGGQYGNGIIFSYNIYTLTETDLHDFGIGDGAEPASSTLLKANNGLLYGLTAHGGANSSGALFSYDIATHKDSTLYNFGSGIYDGTFPAGGLIQATDGLLYGVANGGGVNGNGQIFSYNITSAVLSDVSDFNGSNGATPYGDLIEDDVTGINQLLVISEQLSVYPNPSSDFFNITLSLQQAQHVQLTLYNILGQKVYSTNTYPNLNPTATIPVADLPDGVYVLRVNEENISQQKEIVVAR